MSYNFTEIMAKKADEELITILSARKEEYTEQALQAAQIEFEKRNIPFDKIEKVQQEQSVIKEKEIAVANEPLERDVKRLAMILPFIATMMYSKKYRAGGYERKLTELSNAVFYGRLILIGIIIVLVIINRIF